MINVYVLYKKLNFKQFNQNQMSHFEFQKYIIRNLLIDFINSRKRINRLLFTLNWFIKYESLWKNEIFNEFDYCFRKFNKRIYCELCKWNDIFKFQISKKKMSNEIMQIKKRKTFEKLNFNKVINKRIYSRNFQISFECEKCEISICKIREYWRRLHDLSKRSDDQ